MHNFFTKNLKLFDELNIRRLLITEILFTFNFISNTCINGLKHQFIILVYKIKKIIWNTCAWNSKKQSLMSYFSPSDDVHDDVSGACNWWVFCTNLEKWTSEANSMNLNKLSFLFYLPSTLV